MTVTKKTHLVYAPTPGKSGIENSIIWDAISLPLAVVLLFTAIMSSKYVERNEIMEENVAVTRGAKVSNIYHILYSHPGKAFHSFSISVQSL